MSRATGALAFAAGCAIGVFAMAVVYAECFFRTCKNANPDGFECSNCGSHTDYRPNVPFRFCPICGAFVMRKETV